MSTFRNMHILLVHEELFADTAAGEALRALIDALVDEGIEPRTATTCEDGWQRFLADPEIACVIVNWNGDTPHTARLLHRIREHNCIIPMLLSTTRMDVDSIPIELLDVINGYMWVAEDTPHFMAEWIRHEMQSYVEAMTPPFFGALRNYAEEAKYAWHTPGHMGGVAFLRSPAGRRMFDFYGENSFRADLSISVPELGSLLEHDSVIGEAERNAADTFGADRTFFVLNGTSTANKIVWSGRVIAGDVVLVDRNCHKSLQHAIVMTGAIPVYLVPTRNRHGIIGPVPLEQFSEDYIRKQLAESPLVEGDGPEKIKMTVLTNSTYDGLCYHTEIIEQAMYGLTENLHFDEAWFGYAKFHELYAGRYGMHDTPESNDAPVVFTTQSTHKLLAAFSQCSMTHVRDRQVTDESRKMDYDRFNEAFMMYTSTSPQYGMIASLDVASRMMQHGQGRVLMQEAIEEAVSFRKEMLRVARCLEGDDWWYHIFQPPGLEQRNAKHMSRPLDAPDVSDDVTADESFWSLDPNAQWHGYEGLTKDYMLLDPIKVTVMSPGLDPAGNWEDQGIPADLLSRFLRSRGVVVEKTGLYCFLVLFSFGITHGKSGTLVSKLFRFKTHFDNNDSVETVFPDLAHDYPERYDGMGVQQLAAEMHACLREVDAAGLQQDAYSKLPEPVIRPTAAFNAQIGGGVEQCTLDELDGRTSAVMVVPYPPGIPVLMPGERFDNARIPAIIGFLKLLETYDNRFPGFEHETHGVDPVRDKGGRLRYMIDCVLDK